MKVVPFIIVLLLAGCASEQATKSQPAAAASTAAGADSDDVLKAVEEAIEKGYKVVDQNGQTMYCRKSVKTGSRVQSNMTCLTKDQLVAERRGTEDYIKMIQKGNPQMTN